MRGLKASFLPCPRDDDDDDDDEDDDNAENDDDDDEDAVFGRTSVGDV